MADIERKYYKTKQVCELVNRSDEQVLRTAKKLGLQQKSIGRWDKNDVIKIVQNWYPRELVLKLFDFYFEKEKCKHSSCSITQYGWRCNECGELVG